MASITRSVSPTFIIPEQAALSVREQIIAGWKDQGSLAEVDEELSLTLFDIRLNDDDIDAIFWLLNETSIPLKSLILRCCSNFKKEDLDALGEVLKTNTHLMKIHLEPNFDELFDFNNIRTTVDFGRGDVVAEALKVNTTLTSLTLYGQGLKARSAALFAEAFRTNQTLTAVDLSRNQLGGEGFQVIVEALHDHTALKTLSLKAINIINTVYSESNYTPLIDLLAHHPSLTELNLGSVGLPFDASLAIANTLSTNTTLVRLDYSNNSTSFNTEIGKAFSEAIASNFILEQVFFGICDLERAVVCRISEQIKENKNSSRRRADSLFKMIWDGLEGNLSLPQASSSTH